MAGNTTPVSSRVPVIGMGAVATANTALDGTGTVVTVFTADATNGGLLFLLTAVHLGTDVVTVIRFFLNNGSTNTVAANNSLFHEITLAANTISQVAASIFQTIAMMRGLPAGWKVNITTGTTIAAGCQVTAWGGAF